MIEIRETTLREANAYVEELHRHHGKVVGHKWSLAAYKDGRLCGVAIVGPAPILQYQCIFASSRDSQDMPFFGSFLL